MTCCVFGPLAVSLLPLAVSLLPRLWRFRLPLGSGHTFRDSTVSDSLGLRRLGAALSPQPGAARIFADLVFSPMSVKPWFSGQPLSVVPRFSVFSGLLESAVRQSVGSDEHHFRCIIAIFIVEFVAITL